MINLTIKQALNVLPTINELVSVKLPIKAAYKIARITRKLQEQLLDFESQRVALIKEMGVTDEKGNMVVSEERVPAFTEKLNELMPEGISVDVDGITLPELGDVSLTPLQLLIMEQNQILIN